MDWNTLLGAGGVADGSYEVQLVVEDTAGNTNAFPLSPKTVDNTSPSGSLTAPVDGSVIGGTIAISATAVDATAGVQSVAFEVKGSGAAAFTTVGTDTGAPYSTSWSSAGVADGPADIQAVVTDFAGNTFVTPLHTVTVDNDAPVVALSNPGASSAGTINLTATPSGDTTTVSFERQTGATWTAFATDTTAPFEASLDTTTVADGDLVLRAVATDVGLNTGTSPTRTTRVDNTAPAGSVTSPVASATIGGPSVALTANVTDAGSGVATVVFQIRSAGSAGAWTDVDTDSAAPFTATLDARPLASGDYDIRVVSTDALANQVASAAVRVTVDSTAPTVTFNGLDPVISGAYLLRTTIVGTGTAQVQFEQRVGAGPWTEIDTDTTAPFTAIFDTSLVPDGLVDLRATVTDAYGNSSSFDAIGIRVDNTAPRLVSATPGDGSTLPSAGGITLTATEPIASVDSPLLDGSPVGAPTITGADAMFATGAFSDGPHTLEGWLTDAGGQSRRFRLDFTVFVPSGAVVDAPSVSKSAEAAMTTTLTSVDAMTTVTMHAGSYVAPASDPSDWLVLTVDPTPTGGAMASAALAPGAQIVDVTARWAIAGSMQHAFMEPIEILLTDTSGVAVVPATFEGSHWRAIPEIGSGATTLPTGAADGYFRAADGIHVLTRHLSLFSLVSDFEAPSPPTVATEIARDGLTIRWTPGTDNASGISQFGLYVNDSGYATFGATTYEAKIGHIEPGDTREFTMTEWDGAGNESARTTTLTALPPLVGQTVANARWALFARNFIVGSVTERASSAPAGTIIEPAGVQVRMMGTKVDLVVASAGPAAAAKLSLEVVGTKRIAGTNRTIGARLKLTKAAQVTTTLFSPRHVKLYTWRRQVKAGTSILRLQVPAKLVSAAGRYSLTWTARAGDQTVTRTQKLRVAGAGVTSSGLVEAVLAGDQATRNRIAARLDRHSTRLTQASSDTAFALTASTTRNVQVVVVDVHMLGPSLVHDLRLVFPSVRVLALGGTPQELADAMKSGATVALPRTTSPQRLAAVIERLAHGG